MPMLLIASLLVLVAPSACTQQYSWTTAAGVSALQQCDANMVAWDGSCVCRAGFSGPGCAPCAANTFKSSAGNHSCEACPQHTASLPGSASSAECICGAPGFAPDGQHCAPCPVNTFKAFAGAAPCVACPPSSIAAAAASTQCLCMAGFELQNGVCNPCGVGLVSLSGSPCQQCPTNETTAAPGSPNCTCTVGHRRSSGGRCEPCPPTAYRAAVNATTCSPCPRGMLSTSDRLACVECGPTAYADTNTAACVPCTPLSVVTSPPAATASECVCVSNAVRQDNQCLCGAGHAPTGAACESCPPGFAKNNTGNIACAPCPPGSFVETAGAHQCLACPPGSHTAAGATSRGACKCGPGLQPTINGLGLKVCEPCAADSVCVGGDVVQPCFSQLATSPPGSALQTHCVCQAGFFRKLEPSLICNPCPPNHYCPFNSSQPIPCPPDSLSPHASTSDADCVCSPGFRGA